MSKPCKTCGRTERYRDRSCKHCKKITATRWRKENTEKANAAALAFYRRNKESVWEYQNQKRKTDTQYKLRVYLRNRLRTAIKNKQKTGSAVRDIGCSVYELKLHLEKQFKSGMTWDNWTPAGWHIDHIVPLASFDLTDREQFLKACHYTNLQPLWAKENLAKRDKV